MPRTKLIRPRRTNEKFWCRDVNLFLHFQLHETIMYFGASEQFKGMTTCLGVGVVKRIEKGKDFDLVIMNFGRKFNRKIVVKSNHARRQIYTLKLGQHAWFYGLKKNYKLDKNNPTNVTTMFFAIGFQGWFVPKSFDIKENIQEQETKTEDLSIENKNLVDFIDKIAEKGE